MGIPWECPQSRWKPIARPPLPIYRRPRRRALLEWASTRIQRHGVPFVVGVRFLPSGRLFGGLAAGIVRYPARR